MPYTFLPMELWQIADDVAGFYASHWGVAASTVKREEAVPGGDLGFRPTLHASSRDHHLICVEVALSPYSQSLDSFVLACKNEGLPVRLYVAVPESSAPTFQADLRRARSNGVGVLEQSPAGIQIITEAQPLSLTGLRRPDFSAYRAGLRASVHHAVQTFCGGDPAKGCSNVYDELENVTRRLAGAAKKAGAWRGLADGETSPKLGNIATAPWQPLTRTLLRHLDSGKLRRPRVTEALLGRVLGITTHRNEAGHKPKTRTGLRTRDSRLRTRFEEACDLLQEFDSACRRP